MTDSGAPIAEPAPPDPSPDWVAVQVANLGALTELGMAYARALGRRAIALAEAPLDQPPPPTDPSIAFTRVARMVRQTILLQSKLMQDAQAETRRRSAQVEAADAEAAQALEARRATGRLRRAMTSFIVSTAIEEAHRADPVEVERLSVEAVERLDLEGDDLADFAEIEVKPLAVNVCRALKIDADASWWKDAWDVDVDQVPPAPERPSRWAPPRTSAKPSPRERVMGAAARPPEPP